MLRPTLTYKICYCMWLSSHSNWFVGVMSWCTSALPSLIDIWKSGLVIPECRGSMSWPLLIMFCRLGLIRDVRMIMVQGGRPCTKALGLLLFAVFWLGEWIHQYSDSRLLRGYSSHWRDLEGRRETQTRIKHSRIVSSLWTHFILMSIADDSIGVNSILNMMSVVDLKTLVSLHFQ